MSVQLVSDIESTPIRIAKILKEYHRALTISEISKLADVDEKTVLEIVDFFAKKNSIVKIGDGSSPETIKVKSKSLLE